MIPDLESDALEIARDLIRIDTTNPGRPERPAAEYVADKLSVAGLEPEIYEKEPGRSNLVARLAGDGTNDRALILHAHLDVVPAEASEWTHHPLSGDIADGCLWGRGAIDMKGTAGMIAAIARKLAAGTPPKRDIVFVFFADEEVPSGRGSMWMVQAHRELFEDVEYAIGELGGFSVTTPDGVRLYPIQIAEKGVLAIRLIARGRPGHSSTPHDDNAVVKLASSVARIGSHRFPVRESPSTRVFADHLERLTGRRFDPSAPGDALEGLGSLRTYVEATLTDTPVPTMLQAGSKPNVIPSSAEAFMTMRFTPGFRDESLDDLRALLDPGIDVEIIAEGHGSEAPWEDPLPRAMCDALESEDPAAHPIPFMIPAGTDAKFLTTLGIRCYGFAPVRLPADLDFASLFHGIDERIPVDALGFGARVLYRVVSGFR